MKIVLGSSSPWRKNILAEMGHEFETMSPDIDEKAVRRDDPSELVSVLAEAKSRALLPRLKEPCILITSDQVVVSGGRILEKPADESEARDYIRRSGESPASTVTAVHVVNTATGRQAGGVDVVEIDLAPVPDDVAEAIIAKGEVYTCAGGLNISEPLLRPYLRGLRGDIDSVIGLPKKLTQRLIEQVTQ